MLLELTLLFCGEQKLSKIARKFIPKNLIYNFLVIVANFLGSPQAPQGAFMELSCLYFTQFSSAKVQKSTITDKYFLH